MRDCQINDELPSTEDRSAHFRFCMGDFIDVPFRHRPQVLLAANLEVRARKESRDFLFGAAEAIRQPHCLIAEDSLYQPCQFWRTRFLDSRQNAE